MSGLRATKPIDPKARDAANDAFYKSHPEMVKNGQRVKIKPEASKQAPLRQEWLRLYAKNGGGVEKVKAKHITNALNGANDGFSSAPVGGSTQTCPLPKRTSGKGVTSGTSASPPPPPPPPPPSTLRSTGSSKPSQGKPLNCVFRKATLTCEHGRKASPQGELMVVPSNSSASGDLVDCAMTFSGGCGQHPGWSVSGPSPADTPGLSASVLAKTWTFSALGLVALQAVSPQVYRAEAGGCSGRGRSFEIKTYPPGKVGGKLDLGKLQDWIYGKLGYVVAEDEMKKWTPHWFRGSAEYGGGWQEDKGSWKACFEHAVTIGFDPLYDMSFKYPVYPEGLVPQAIASWLPGGVVIEAKASAKLQYAFKAAYWPSDGKTVVSEHAAVGGGAGSLALQLELKSASLEVVEAAASGESGFSLEVAAVKGDDAAIKLEFKFGGLKAKASLKLAWGWVELSREFQVISEWAPDPWEWKLT
jgi:hypothetical protein